MPSIPAVIFIRIDENGEQLAPAEIKYFASDIVDAKENARRLAAEQFPGVVEFAIEGKFALTSSVPITNKDNLHIMIADMPLHEVLNYLMGNMGSL